jgi:hypothetical protein
MSLNAGSVTIDADGNATGSGLAIDLYNAGMLGSVEDPNNPASVGWIGYPPDLFKTLVITGRQHRAAQAEAMASAIVTHFKNHGLVVTVIAPDSCGVGIPPANVETIGGIT